MTEEYYKELYPGVPVLYHALDEKGCVVDVNHNWHEKLGYPDTEVLGKDFGSFLTEESAGIFSAAFNKLKNEGRLNNLVINIKAKDGSVMKMRLAGKVRFGKNGSFRKAHCVVQGTDDNSEYFSDIFHQTLFEQTSVPMIVTNPATRVVIDVNQAACELYGADYKDMVNRTIVELTLENFEKIETLRTQVLEGNLSPFESMIADFNNNIKTVEVYPTVFNAGDSRCIVLALTDVTEKKHQEQALRIKDRISNAFISHDEGEIFSDISATLRETFDSEFCYVSYIGSDGSMVSPSMTTEIWSKCQMEKKTFEFPREVWGGMWGESLTSQKSFFRNGGLAVPGGHLELHNAMAVVICDGERLLGQFVVANKKESYTHSDLRLGEQIADTIKPILKFWLEDKRSKELLNQKKEYLKDQLVIEMDKAKKQEQLFFEQKKFVDMGQMMSAIAHQWRQPLNNIHLLMHSMKMLNEGEEAGFSFDQLYKMHSDAVEFMSRTIDSFRNYLNTKPKKIRFSVSDAVLETINLVCAQFQSQDISIFLSCDGKNIPIDCDMNGRSKCCEMCDDSVVGDIGNFHQIMLNVLSNARDALLDYRDREGVQGEIRISGVVTHDAVTLDVFNTGSHIPSDVLPKIFAPYFTTKEEGKGTGVGLYMTKMFVEDGFGGKISAENADNGVIFKIVIPRAVEQTV